MKSNVENGRIDVLIIYISIGIVLLAQYRNSFNYEEAFLFVELIAAYFWTMGLLTYSSIRFDFNVFEPITMITAIYEGIFTIKPVFDLHDGKMVEHGVYVISGGAKATALFILGYTIFFASYFIEHRVNIFPIRNDFGFKSIRGLIQKPQLLALYIAWIITYGLCIYCMLTQGLSLKYIFSFGTDGLRTVNENNTSLLFLSNFGITLVSLWLLIMEYSTNKTIKAVITTLSLIYILMRNARWLMLVFLLAPVVLFYLKRNRQPRVLWVMLIGFGGLAVFAWMQANRATLASGGAMQVFGKNGFTFDILLAPLESDLSTYRTFYSMVERYPKQYDYIFGKTFFYVFILFVPRAIWPGKPDNPVRDMIEHSLNKQARASGTAVANIGELYANFGILGIFAGMYILGWIAASLKHYVMNSESSSQYGSNRQIAYAILFPLFFQWIARGNFSGNLYLTLFALLPFIVERIIRKIRQTAEIK